MKIALLSTAYPLRGGIAQHAGSLYKKLVEQGHSVTVITFKRQYPALLFPGKTQFETGSDETFRIPSEPIMDSIGPWTWWAAARRLRQIQPDLVVVNFWMPFFALCLGTICRLAKRWTTAKILYLCHNIIPHEKRPGDIALIRFAFRGVDSFIVQSKVVERDLLQLIPDANYQVVPHPVYDIFGDLVDQDEARRMLNLDAERVLLFFGYVRTYKGLDWLLMAMPAILEKLPVRLLVVGEFYDDEARYRRMIENLGISRAVKIVSDFVPSEEVPTYFSAADVVVLPYKSATQSGIVQLAYHFNKPCIVTDVGGLAEVVINGVTGFVVPPEKPEEIAKAVLRFYSENKSGEFSRNVSIEKRKYTWERMVDSVLASATNAKHP